MKIIAIVALLSLAVAVFAQVDEIWVANREGSIDIIDPATDTITATIDNTALVEPMYLAQVGDYVWVTDRGTSTIRAYSAEDKSAAGSVDLGAEGFDGLFHMWAFGETIYVVADNAVNNGVAVVDVSGFPGTTPTVNGVNTPDSVSTGFPHDVTATEDYIYAVYLNGGNFTGTIIVQYDTTTLDVVTENNIPFTDCHVAIRSATNLWAQCQNDNSQESAIYILTSTDISDVIRTIDSDDISVNITSAHGDWISDDYTFVTNIGDPTTALMVFDRTGPYTFLGADATPDNTPHNVAALSDSSKAYVSHTIPTTSYVSVFEIDATGQPAYDSRIETTDGTAFGIFTVTYTPSSSGTSSSASSANTLSMWM